MHDKDTAKNTALLQAMEEIQSIVYDYIDNADNHDTMETLIALSAEVNEYRKNAKSKNLEYRYERKIKKMLGELNAEQERKKVLQKQS